METVTHRIAGVDLNGRMSVGISPLMALLRHRNDSRKLPLSPRKQTYVHDLTMPVYEFTP